MSADRQKSAETVHSLLVNLVDGYSDEGIAAGFAALAVLAQPCQCDIDWRAGLAAAESEVSVLREGMETLRAERDELQRTLDGVEFMVTAGEPPDHVFRVFQRLHGLPETGGPRWQERAEAAEAETESLREKLAEAERAMPATFYGDRPLAERVEKMAALWNRAVASNEELQDSLAEAKRERDGAVFLRQLADAAARKAEARQHRILWAIGLDNHEGAEG